MRQIKLPQDTDYVIIIGKNTRYVNIKGYAKPRWSKH